MGRGDLVVSVLAFYSYDQSSNLIDYLNFMYEKTKINKKRGRGRLSLKKWYIHMFQWIFSIVMKPKKKKIERPWNRKKTPFIFIRIVHRGRATSNEKHPTYIELIQWEQIFFITFILKLLNSWTWLGTQEVISSKNYYIEKNLRLI